MPKVSDAHRAARRDEIVAAAMRSVMRDGYRNASMATIIAESGLSVGAVYGHFASKQELLVAVAEKVFEARVADITTARGGSGPLAPGQLMRTIIRGIAQDQVAPIIPQVWAEATYDPEVRAVARRIFTRLYGTLRAELSEWAAEVPGRVAGDPALWAKRAAPVILSAVPGYLIQQAILDDFDAAGYLAALDEVYLR